MPAAGESAVQVISSIQLVQVSSPAWHDVARQTPAVRRRPCRHRNAAAGPPRQHIPILLRLHLPSGGSAAMRAPSGGAPGSTTTKLQGARQRLCRRGVAGGGSWLAPPRSSSGARRAASAGPVRIHYPHLVRIDGGFGPSGRNDRGRRGAFPSTCTGAVGEYNVFGHWYHDRTGPWLRATASPADSSTAIFTQHSLRDPGLAAERPCAICPAGKECVPDLAASCRSQEERYWDVLSTSSATGGTVAARDLRGPREFLGRQPRPRARPFAFPKIELSTWPYVREVALVREMADFGVLLRRAMWRARWTFSTCRKPLRSFATARAGAQRHPPLPSSRNRCAARRSGGRRALSLWLTPVRPHTT